MPHYFYRKFKEPDKVRDVVKNEITDERVLGFIRVLDAAANAEGDATIAGFGRRGTYSPFTDSTNDIFYVFVDGVIP